MAQVVWGTPVTVPVTATVVMPGAVLVAAGTVMEGPEGAGIVMVLVVASMV